MYSWFSFNLRNIFYIFFFFFFTFLPFSYLFLLYFIFSHSVFLSNFDDRCPSTVIGFKCYHVILLCIFIYFLSVSLCAVYLMHLNTLVLYFHTFTRRYPFFSILQFPIVICIWISNYLFYLLNGNSLYISLFFSPDDGKNDVPESLE